MLEGELNTPTSSFAAFVNDSFMTSTAYGGDIYGSPSQPYSYTWKAADADTSGAEEITVTLRRRPGEDAEKLNLSGVGQSVSTKSGWRDQLTSWQSKRLPADRSAAGRDRDRHQGGGELRLYRDL